MGELSYIRRKYTSKGVYLRSESYDPLLYIQRPSVESGPFWIDTSMSNPSMGFMPAYKRQSLTAQYQTEQLIPFGHFPLESFSDAGTLLKWTGTAKIRRKLISQKDNGPDARNGASSLQSAGPNYGIYLGIPMSDVNQARYIESEPVLLEKGPGTSFRLSLGFQVNLPPLQQTTPPTIYMQVKLGNSYLTSAGIWQSDLAYIRIPVTQFSQAGKFTLEQSYILESGFLTVRLYELVMSGTGEVPEKTLLIDHLTVDLLHNSDDLPQEVDYEIKNVFQCTYVPEEIELFHADVPDITNAKLAFKNAVYLGPVAEDGESAGDVTRKWYRLGKAEEKPIQQILLEQTMAFNEKPRQRLNGTLRAKRLPYASILQDVSNLPRLFAINALVYNPADCSYEVELLELDRTLPETSEQLYEYDENEFNELEYN